MIDFRKKYGKIFKLLLNEQLGEAIEIYRKDVLTETSDIALSERFEKLCSDYNLMLDFLHKGFKDDQRASLYQKLIVNLDRIAADSLLSTFINQHISTQNISKRKDDLRLSKEVVKQNLELFVAEQALLDLEDQNEVKKKRYDINTQHFDFMNKMFESIWLSEQWTTDDADFFEETILSPATDMVDAMILVSAVFLSNSSVFDPYKTLLLLNISKKSNDTKLKQRALVGWILTINERLKLYPEIALQVKDYASDSDNAKEIIELQKQMYFCLNAERDHDAIQKEIMPDLINGSNIRITRFGIEEKDDTSLNDILHPEATEEALDKVEKSFQKMMDMQRLGSDIYFGGFAQMKRFSFFYKTMNWLCPFTINNPAIANALNSIGNENISKNLLNSAPLCDSDKYSLILAISQVISKMPAAVREMMSSDEVLNFQSSVQDPQSDTYQRRLYLQDLYRFFNLYPDKDVLNNPFVKQQATNNSALFVTSPLIMNNELKTLLPEFGVFLYKQERISDLKRLISAFDEAESDIISLLNAHVKLKENNYEEALSEFNKILEHQPDNVNALTGKAKSLLFMSRYEEAAAEYLHISKLRPNKIVTQLNYCAAIAHTSKAESSLDILYKLYYDNPDRKDIHRMLSWCLLCSQRIEQAKAEYEKILNQTDNSTEDLLNAGYCFWINREISKAVDLFIKHFRVLPNKSDTRKTIYNQFVEDAHMLRKNNIDKLEMNLMIDLICKQIGTN